MIYYIGQDNPYPSGGVKTQYRHVEILNKHGFPASMLHEKPGFTAATWFNSSAPISYNGMVKIRSGDVLVWPEILRASIRHIPSIKQVIFNQNVHYTWRGTLLGRTDPYDQFIVGTMVLTEYERKFLHNIYPDHPISVIRHGIDPAIFGYDGREKRKQIAYMPRKHREEAEAVFGWLRATGALDGWDVVSIDACSERDSAGILLDAGVFFAFGYPEGGTLPPFEALAAGCEVIGYGGFASDDLLVEAGGRKVSSGNTCQFTAVASGVLSDLDLSSISCLSRSRRVLDMFNMKQEEESLIKFMKEIING